MDFFIYEEHRKLFGWTIVISTIVLLVLILSFRIVGKNSFPELPNDIYFGSIEIEKEVYPLFIKSSYPESLLGFWIDKDKHIDFSGEYIKRGSQAFIGNKYQPVRLKGVPGSIYLIGDQVSEGSFQGLVIDENRNGKGNWQINKINFEKTEPLDLKNSLIMWTNQRILEENKESIQAEIQNEILETQKAKKLISNSSILMLEGSKKLRESENERYSADKKLKYAKAESQKLRDRIVVTQLLSPQSKFYEVSQDSLRIEQDWFLGHFRNNELLPIKNNISQESK